MNKRSTKDMIVDIVTVFFSQDEHAFNTSLRTIFRGPHKNAPVAMKFKNLYCYGYDRHMSLDRINHIISELLQSGTLIGCLNYKGRTFYEPSDKDNIQEKYKYIMNLKLTGVW